MELNPEIEAIQKQIKFTNALEKTTNEMLAKLQNYKREQYLLLDDLRSKCRHKFPKGQTLMGRGECVKCGASDY